MPLHHLPNSQPGEEVVLFLRRHWIDLVKVFLFTSLLILVPVFALAALLFGGVQVFENPLSGGLAAVILSTYAVIVLTLTITEMTDYWLDSWIVTTERVIDIEQLGLFNRTLSEVHLSQIQDITSETKGFLGTFLTFGNVHVQSAAEKKRFEFKNIDNPDKVKITISELANTCKVHHKHERGTGAHPPDQIASAK